MTALTYAILEVGDVWQIVCDRRRIGRFTTRDEASRVAALLTHEATSSGHDVEMLLQGRFGELHNLRFSHQGETSTETPGGPALAGL